MYSKTSYIVYPGSVGLGILLAFLLAHVHTHMENKTGM